jgi:hypothetical protein
MAWYLLHAGCLHTATVAVLVPNRRGVELMEALKRRSIEYLEFLASTSNLAAAGALSSLITYRLTCSLPPSFPRHTVSGAAIGVTVAVSHGGTAASLATESGSDAGPLRLNRSSKDDAPNWPPHARLCFRLSAFCFARWVRLRPTSFPILKMIG